MMVTIIGFGFVGKSVYEAVNSAKNYRDVLIHDPMKGFEQDEESILASNVIFICVPTPTVDGSQDLRIFNKVFFRLLESEYEGLIVIKSTIMPHSISQYQNSLCSIIHSPEFLNQCEPFMPQENHIVGCNEMAMAKLSRYRNLFPSIVNMEIVDLKTAAMIKYVHNIHGALKVAFFNEIFDICEMEKIDYRTMLNGLFSVNNNVGRQYTKICADGKRGFGGACFPKDTIAFEEVYDTKTVAAAIDSNKKYGREEMKACLAKEPWVFAYENKDPCVETFEINDITIEEDDCGNINKRKMWPYADMSGAATP